MYPPPPQEWKVGIRVRQTFYFSGRSDIGGWQGTPRIEIGLNINATEKTSFQLRSASAFYNLYTPFSHLILCLKKLVNFNFR